MQRRSQYCTLDSTLHTRDKWVQQILDVSLFIFDPKIIESKGYKSTCVLHFYEYKKCNWFTSTYDLARRGIGSLFLHGFCVSQTCLKKKKNRISFSHIHPTTKQPTETELDMLLTYQVWLFILKKMVLVFEREQQVKLASQNLSSTS